MDLNENKIKKPFFAPRVKKEIREWAVSLTVALVAVLLIRTFLFTTVGVAGPSMESTLYTGDRLIVTILDVKLGGLNRFDVVVCHYPDRSEQFVKRVIGLPGETVEVKNGVTLINGEPLEEPFLYPDKVEKYRAGKLDFPPVEVPQGHYFVMGDHRDDSNDSRPNPARRLAPKLIAQDQILGHARYIMWPLDRIGAVEAR